MKFKPLLLPLILLFALLTACSNSPKIYDLASMTQLFEDAELHLKPQSGEGNPAIHNTIPTVYELLDDSLYIYVFDSEEELVEAVEGVEIEDLFNLDTHDYRLKNVLLIYHPSSPADVNFDQQINDILQAA